MTKKQLEEKIIEMKEDHAKEVTILRQVVCKLVHDCIKLKPKPQGKVEDRIAIFGGNLKFNGKSRLTIASEVCIFTNMVDMSSCAGELRFERPSSNNQVVTR